MTNWKWKLIGMITAAATAGITLLTNVVEEHKMKETIREEVERALAERENEKEEKEES